MADSKTKRKLFRLPRKTVIVCSGAGLLLLTVSAAAAYLAGGARLLGGGNSSVYGLDCTLVDSVSFRQGDGERWVREYIAVGGSDGIGRVRTAVRVARQAAGVDDADLVLVVVLDRNGPQQRAEMRGAAVGARVVYAPHPARVDSVAVPLAARYTKAEPTAAGYFYGDAASVPTGELETMAAAMTAPYGCRDSIVAKSDAETPAHGSADTGH